MQIIFEGVVGTSYYSDASIDDIAMLFGQYCPKGNLYPSNAVPLPPTPVPTTLPPMTPPIPGFDCDFEEDQKMCGWVNLQGSSDNYDWGRQSTGIGILNAGPLGDHTTGIYLVIISV